METANIQHIPCKGSVCRKCAFIGYFRIAIVLLVSQKFSVFCIRFQKQIQIFSSYTLILYNFCLICTTTLLRACSNTSALRAVHTSILHKRKPRCGTNSFEIIAKSVYTTLLRFFPILHISLLRASLRTCGALRR